MKTTFTKPVLLSGLAVAVATMLPSCVDPYAHHSDSPQQVTTYRAGYEVRSLPPGYRTEVIGGTQYYNYNGTYYRPRSGRYVVVEAPRDYHRPQRHEEVIVRELPRGYRVVNRHGARYYQVHDTYYERRGTGYVQVQLSH